MAFYACVIVNPASAAGSTGRHWPELRAALDRVLDRWDSKFTLGPGDATRLAREAVRDGYEMIVSIGGDGTMNEVVTGLFDPGAERPLREDLVLGSVRQGTGGDFARYLGLPGKVPACVAHLAGERTRPSDLGLIELTEPGGATARRAFLNIASFGLSGVVVDKVNHTTKALGGRASFMIGSARGLAAYRPQRIRVSVDGAPFFEGPTVQTVVANGQYFGGGMHVAAEAAIDDGLFDVLTLTELGPKQLLSAGDIYGGRLSGWSTVRHTRGRVVHAEPLGDPRPVLLDVDGEQPGRLPAKMTIVPSAVRLKIG